MFTSSRYLYPKERVAIHCPLSLGLRPSRLEVGVFSPNFDKKERKSDTVRFPLFSLWHEDNFPEFAPLFEIRLGVPRLSKREHPIDEWPNLPGFNRLEHRLELGPRTEHGAVHGDMFQIHRPEVEVRLLSPGRTGNTELAAIFQYLERHREQGVTDDIEHGIDRSPVRFKNLFGERLGPV